jgi:putative MFS transporter
MADTTVRGKRIDDAPMNALVWRIAIFTIGGFVVDGYILGQAGIVLSMAGPELGLDALWTGLIGAASLAGILIGAPVVGRLSDRFGRQKLLAIDLLIITAIALLHLVLVDPVWIVVLRFLMGIAIGAEYAIGAAILSEFAPTRRRGVLLGCLNAGWILGFVAAFMVGFGMRAAEMPWPWILATTAILSAVVFALRVGSPESPRWLIAHGRAEDARRIIARHYGSGYGIDGLDRSDADGPAATFATLFSGPYVRRTLFAGIFWACQVIPLFALTIFLPQVFEALGISSEFGAEMLVNCMLLAGAVAGVFAIKLFSRRGFTIWTFVIVFVALLGMAFSGSLPVPVAIAAFAVFVLVGSAASNLEFVYPSEIFPTEVRASGLGFATAISRVGAAVSTFLLPVALASLGTLPTMLVLAGFVALGAVVSIAWAPETKHQSLEEATAA